MTEKVYSTQRVKNLGGRKIHNPVHFVRVDPEVKVVYVQDGYPAIVDAYTEAGAKVRPLSDLPEVKQPAAAAKKE